MLKRNQIMITALAIMIAVAGYLNFAGTKAGQEQLASADASNAEEEDMTALLDLSEEDIVSDLDSANVSDIESLDSDQEAAAEAIGSVLKEGNICAVGNGANIRADEDRFDQVVSY